MVDRRGTDCPAEPLWKITAKKMNFVPEWKGEACERKRLQFLVRASVKLVRSIYVINLLMEIIL